MNKSNEIICYCNNVKVIDIKKIIERNPRIRFEEFQKNLNAGTTCTACILNLEDEFVKYTSLIVKRENYITSKNFFEGGLKQLLYKLIDFISPSIPIVLINYFPILFCKNLEIFIWIANYSNLYKLDKNIVEHDIKIDFYSACGKLIWNKILLLEKNNEIKLKIPTELLKEDYDKEIIHGWIKLTKIAKKSGYRGTTRPQIQFVTNVASCAVHGQNVKKTSGGSHSFVLNFSSERQFLSFFNLGLNKINIEISLLKKNGTINKLNTISLDCYESILYEVKLESTNIKRLDIATILWTGEGIYKCHAIITDKNLTRFSIDHQ